MPELPEVQTTVNGINSHVVGHKITDIWTDYKSNFHKAKDNIKNPDYFDLFKKAVMGTTITKASRQGKNVLIHLSNHKTILVHMKMTGHFLYGKYIFDQKKNTWEPEDKNGPLGEMRNKFIHLVFTLTSPSVSKKARPARSSSFKSEQDDKKHLVFSDMRKFAKIFLFDTENAHRTEDLAHLGPDPLSKEMDYGLFKERINKNGNGKIKQALMDQSTISGIGNIYSDEILWTAGIHPLSMVAKIPDSSMKKLYKSTKEALEKGIAFGGDSDSDYRNIHGLPGKFQNTHKAYRKTGKTCPKSGCGGTIKRMKIGGRSAHFCDKHQILYK